MLTRLMLMLPGMRVGVGVRPFKQGHGRIVWVGSGDSWSYVWPDGSTASGGERRLDSEVEDAYQRLAAARFPPLEEFFLEVDTERGPYRVTCSALEGSVWEHPVTH